MRVSTQQGACASFEEKSKGMLRLGTLAEFVVLGADPQRTDPDKI